MKSENLILICNFLIFTFGILAISFTIIAAYHPVYNAYYALISWAIVWAAFATRAAAKKRIRSHYDKLINYCEVYGIDLECRLGVYEYSLSLTKDGKTLLKTYDPDRSVVIKRAIAFIQDYD